MLSITGLRSTKSVKIPKWHSEAVIRRTDDNPIVKRKRTKRHTKYYTESKKVANTSPTKNGNELRPPVDIS